MKITAKKLSDVGAFCKDLEQFRERWPRGAQPTVGNIAEAAALGLDWKFLTYLLPPESERECIDIWYRVHEGETTILARHVADGAEMALLSALLLELP